MREDGGFPKVAVKLAAAFPYQNAPILAKRQWRVRQHIAGAPAV
jgi:hypothetical protein